MGDKVIMDKILELITLGTHIGTQLRSSDSYDAPTVNKQYYREARKWEGASINLLKLRFGKDSDYYIHFTDALKKHDNYYQENVDLATGVLEYVYDALKHGLVDDLYYKKEILVFTNLLEQAYEFLSSGLNLAAGIYGRIVLETVIKEFAAKNGIQDQKFDQIIIKLRKANRIQKPYENSLRANYEIGSWAAHGDEKFQKLTDNEIKEFLTFIRDKILTLE